MPVTHVPDDDDVVEVEIVGDGPFVKATEFNDIREGKADIFKRPSSDLKKFSGVSTALRKRATRQENQLASGHGSSGSRQLTDKFATGYGMFDVVEPPLNLDYLAKLYEISAAHRAAVDAKVTNISGLGYEWKESRLVQERIADLLENETISLERYRRRIDAAKQDMYDWLEGTTDELSFTEVLNHAVTDLLTTGNCYIEIGRTDRGDIGYIGHIPSTSMRRRTQKDGYVQVVAGKALFFKQYGKQYERGWTNPIGNPGDKVNEVIHIYQYTPTNSFYGVPEIISAAKAVAGAEFAARFNLDYFEHKAVPRYIITLKGAKLSGEAENKIINFLTANLKGQHHRTLYIPLPADSQDRKVEFKMEPIETRAQDASFTKYQEMTRDEILMAHRTPLPQIGYVTNVSLGASRDSARMFKEQVCRPWQDIFEKRLKPVFEEKTNAFYFHLIELTLTDEETASRIHERYLRWEVFTPNDVLEWLGKKGRPGGDKPVGAMAQANARGSAQERARANASRTRDQERSSGPDKDTQSSQTRNPKGEGRATA
jgi:PBSX family phage portal protein